MLLELWTGTHRAYKGHLDKDRAVSEQADCPALLLNSYKIWGKLPNYSVPQFPHQESS